MKLDSAAQQQFIQEAQLLGMEAFFLEPVTFPQYEGNSRGIGTDPFVQLPSTRCVIALIMGYEPFLPRSLPQVSAYYVASHRGYKAAETLRNWLSARGAAVVNADLPVRAVLEQAKIASIGRNGLAAMQKKGSYFYAKLLLSDAFEPEEYADTRLPCVNCGRCEKACPVGAITETLDPLRCIKEHLDGRVIPQNVKTAMVSLLGCEICQRVCARNASISAIEPSPDMQELFSFKRLITAYRKSDFANIVGKNMLRGGRLQAQALILAARAGNAAYVEEAQRLCASEQICLSDAAHWYLAHFKPPEESK